MEKKLDAKMIARTGMLLAICIVFQLFKGISVYITGPAVNAVLIIAALSVGLAGGTIIAVIAPLVAFLVGATPILQLVPQMLPVIMVGNFLIVLFGWLYGKKGHLLFLVLGALAKACFLWLTVWYVVLPLFGGDVPEPMQATVKTTFSIVQLVTALIGGLIAYLVWRAIRSHIE